MATQTSINPVAGTTNVSRDTEIVINLSGVVDINTLNVSVANTIFPDPEAIVLGSFVNEWTGEIIDIGGGVFRIIIIRPARVHLWQQGTKFIVTGDVDSSGIPGTNFTTIVLDFSTPLDADYTEVLNLTSLPSGWANQTSGTGSTPLFSSSGMDTRPGASGTSFIRKNAFGLDFDQGFLIDITAELPSPSQNPGGTINKVVRVVKGGQGIVSLSLDFVNGEIWLTDVVGITTTGFRPALSGTEVTFRLSIKNSGEDLIARVYAGTTGSDTAPLLQQTLGPSLSTSGSADCVDIGSLNTGDKDIRIVSAKILNLSDPDIFYPFPTITNIKPISGQLSGGENLRVDLARNIDLNLGDELFFSQENIRDDSTANASIDPSLGELDLILQNTGTGEASATYIHALNGDIPSGIDVQFDIGADQTLINQPPSDEVVLAAAELKSTGDSLAIELVSDAGEGKFFRAVQKSNNIEILTTKVIDITQANHTLRFTRAFNKLIVCVNGVPAFDTSLKQGSGILRFYSRSDTLAVSLTSKITNFIVRPVITVGGEPILTSGLLSVA